MLFDESFAVTATENAVPAVADTGPLTAKWVAAPGLTVTVCNPLTDAFAMSVAVTSCEPRVRSVTLNVWLPASAPVKP